MTNIKYVNELFEFIKNSPSVYHNINLVKGILNSFNFQELKENEKWKLENNKNYYVVRSDASIIMFKIGNDPHGFNIICSHNDSPSFKIKPNYETTSLSYVRAKVETYGSPLYFTWFDRPLSLAGRVLVKTKTGVDSRLVDLTSHKFIVPSVAPHVGNIDVQKPSVQNELIPIVGLNGSSLKELIKSRTCFEEGEEILSHDLFLYNKEEPSSIGVNHEMISTCKLDDLECAFTSLEAFLESTNNEMINTCVIFNNEEIGSASNNAAASTFLTDVFERICNCLGLDKYVMYASSFLVSADNAHAVHPSRIGSTDIENPVFMNKGIVIKQSASLSYTSDALSMAKFENILVNNKIPYQVFANNSDIRGGGTLGRILLSHLSVTCVDIGLAQLSMHSCYETAGAHDLEYMVKGLKAFYETNK